MKIDRFNESSTNEDYQAIVENTEAWNKLQKYFGRAISEFKRDISNEIEYEEGNSDNDRAVGLAIQSAVDAHYGY